MKSTPPPKQAFPEAFPDATSPLQDYRIESRMEPVADPPPPRTPRTRRRRRCWRSWSAAGSCCWRASAAAARRARAARRLRRVPGSGRWCTEMAVVVKTYADPVLGWMNTHVPSLEVSAGIPRNGQGSKPFWDPILAFSVNSPPIFGFLFWWLDWDVHGGYDLDFDP